MRSEKSGIFERRENKDDTKEFFEAFAADRSDWNSMAERVSALAKKIYLMEFSEDVYKEAAAKQKKEASEEASSSSSEEEDSSQASSSDSN